MSKQTIRDLESVRRVLVNQHFDKQVEAHARGKEYHAGFNDGLNLLVDLLSAQIEIEMEKQRTDKKMQSNIDHYMDFYNVDSIQDLIEAQSTHIRSLQMKLTESNGFNNVTGILRIG